MEVVGEDDHRLDAERARRSDHTVCRTQRRQDLGFGQERLPAIGGQGEEVRCAGHGGATIA